MYYGAAWCLQFGNGIFEYIFNRVILWYFFCSYGDGVVFPQRYEFINRVSIANGEASSALHVMYP